MAAIPQSQAGIYRTKDRPGFRMEGTQVEIHRWVLRTPPIDPYSRSTDTQTIRALCVRRWRYTKRFSEPRSAKHPFTVRVFRNYKSTTLRCILTPRVLNTASTDEERERRKLIYKIENI